MKRLRVVGVRTIPTMPDQHTQDSVYVIAKKAVDLIRGVHRL